VDRSADILEKLGVAIMNLVVQDGSDRRHIHLHALI
jgi:hypothetical protein